MQQQAIVIGGSMGGLFAANLLYRAGWDVHVYERGAEELEGRGAGIVTHPELLDSLAAAGVRVDDSIGVRVHERVALNRDGSIAARTRQPQILTAWARLYHVLRAAFPAERYHGGMQFASFEQDASGVTAVFANGRQVHAHVLIAADGFRSTVRALLLPQARPRYSGYVAWRGLVEESALSERIRKDVFPYFAFGLPPREQFVGYPVAGSNHATEPGQRRYNFVWYRPAAEHAQLQDLLTDASGKVWTDGIPPPLIRPAVLQQARQAAREVLAPQLAELVASTQGLFFQPIFDLESDALAFGRVCLLGDAAFVARPHCGMGVTKAAGDARELAAALEQAKDVAAGLKQYERRRLEFGRFIVGHARALGAYMEAQLSSAQDRANAELHRSVQAVMRDTAVSPARY